MEVRWVQMEANSLAHAKGFWEGWEDPVRRIPECLALVHSEVSEALECYRDPNHEPLEAYESDGGKPEGIASELADAVIRIGDLSEELGIDLTKAIEEKMQYNWTRRGGRYGGKRA